MKWFKHNTTKRMHNEIVLLMDQFGYHKGYACYFLLLEFCAERFENEQEIIIHERTLKQLLGLTSKKMEDFLKFCQKLQIFSYQKNQKTYSLYWRELTDIADEYSKKVRRNSGQNRDKSTDIVPIYKKEKTNKLKRVNESEFFKDLLASIQPSEK